MEALISLAIFAAIVVAVYWLAKARDHVASSAYSAVNRKVRSGTHQAGLEIAHGQFFYATDAPRATIIKALRSAVKAGEKVPGGLSATHVAASDNDTVHYAHGSRLGTAFRATAAFVTAAFEDGTKQPGVVLVFSDVKVADGVVAEVGAMKALKHDVLTALRASDPTVEEENLV